MLEEIHQNSKQAIFFSPNQNRRNKEENILKSEILIS